jgi:pimeloyl-ACP methyl ester carboxylesterase
MITAALAVPAVTACSDDKPGHYVLVHGAWSNHAAWDAVAAKLRADGATVDAVDLPGHGDDTTPIDQLSLAAYADRVDAAIDAASGPVIVVGHSAGGVVIAQAAEDRPDAIRSLVFVGAFVPLTGQSLFALSMMDAGSKIGPSLENKGATLGIDSVAFPDLFCADCDADAKAALIAGYRDEAAAPFQEPVMLSSSFGDLAKTYIHTTNDQVISHAFQLQMTAATPMTHEHDLATSHMAMLAEPDALAALLLDE